MIEQARPSPSRAFVLGHLLVCSCFWGSSFLFIKLTGGAISPLALAAGRGLIGAAALAAYVAWLGQSPIPRRDEIRHWLVLGTTNGWVPNVLVAYALVQLASGPAAMIQAGGPLVTAIFAHFLFAEERIGLRRLAGIGLGMAGVALLIGPRLVEGGGTALGMLAMVGVTLGYSVGNLYARAVPATAGDPARLALGQHPPQRRLGVGGLEQGRVEQEATALVLGDRDDEKIADDLALRCQQRAIAGLVRRHRLQVVGDEVLQEGASLLAGDTDDATVDQMGDGHGIGSSGQRR